VQRPRRRPQWAPRLFKAARSTAPRCIVRHERPDCPGRAACRASSQCANKHDVRRTSRPAREPTAGTRQRLAPSARATRDHGRRRPPASSVTAAPRRTTRRPRCPSGSSAWRRRSTVVEAGSPRQTTHNAAASAGRIEPGEDVRGREPGALGRSPCSTTDGIPEECTPNDVPSIDEIPARGLSGNRASRTFAIGVFTSMTSRRDGGTPSTR